MAYIDKAYYDSTFKGTQIPDDEFPRLAEIASDVIASVATVEIDENAAKTDNVKKPPLMRWKCFIIKAALMPF